ncbi:MAG TPA: transglycosylase SLT domain-containing protein [Methylomirabilota bacterium]|nr:transglycosylase SLT domain-containing protein [Methylomirabilota bacterium]
MMDRAALVALLCGILVGGAPAGAPADSRRLEPALERYREAHEALAGGEFARARAAFESLPREFILADYAAFFAAESQLRAGEEAAALDHIRQFLERFPDSTLVPQALLAAHDTAFRLGRWAEAEREARRFLTRASNHPEAGRVLVRLAEARAAQGLVAEALADLKRRWVEAPASTWGEVAREVLEDLAALHGVPIPPLSAEEQLLRAQRLADASEFGAAAKGLEELLAQGPDPAMRHRTLVRLAPALGRLQRAPDGIVLLQAAVAEPATPWRASLFYELARLFRRTNQAAAAVPILERLLAEHPDSPQVPDAWLALARTQLDLGKPASARASFQALVRASPDSAAAASARWELAWLEYRAGRLREAALAFRQLSTVPSYRLAGLYWSARALDGGGEKGAAAVLFREIVSRAPRTYYGLLAARRLRGALPTPVAAPIQLPTDGIALLEPERAFQKSRALWRLGFEGHALVELETLGRDPIVEAGRAWGLAVAFAQIGEAGRSLRYLRRSFGGAADAGTPGLRAEFWRLFYPFGYADLVKEAARRAGLEPFFVAAVIREESSYDARARSWVGAVGLMQLMPETARLVAADAGVRFADPAALWEPPVNIALGTHYLGQLRTRFPEPLLVAASYNAGPHRVQRWLAERRLTDLEEFVDQIPFDETRAFVKRVYTSWQHYRRVYGAPGEPPRRGEAEAMPRLSR